MIDINRYTIAIALAHARRAVREEVWAKGGKPNLVPMSVIQRMAKDYLIEHRELIDKARPVAEKIYQQHQRKLAHQRELRRLKRRLTKVTSAAQLKGPCETTTIPVQNIGAK
jgi:hypothetical protein